MIARDALLVGFVLVSMLGAALAGPAPTLLAGRKNIRLVGRGICSQILLQNPPCGGGDKALKLGSDRTLPCTIWQLAAVAPSGPSKNLVGVPVTIKSTCRMAPNPVCNASLTGPTICTDGYTNMGAGGQWVIEAVGSASPQRYRLRSLARTSCPSQYLGAAKVAGEGECGNPPRLGFRAPAGAGATYLDLWIIEDAPAPPPPKRSPPPPKRSPPPPPKRSPPPPKRSPPPVPTPPSPRPPSPSPPPSPPPPSPPTPPPPPQEPMWIPAGTGAINITDGNVTSISSGFDPQAYGPLFAASNDNDGKGAVYFSTEESVCGQGSGRRLLGTSGCRRRRRLNGAGGWVKYLGQDFGDVGGFISMQLDAAGQPAVAYRDSAGAGIFKESNGSDWNFGCTFDGKFAEEATHVSLAFTPATVFSFIGPHQVVAYADGLNYDFPVAKYCEDGQWKTVSGTPYSLPVRDITAEVWPWFWSNSTISWTVALSFVDVQANFPVLRYYNLSTSDWETAPYMPLNSSVSSFKTRFSNLIPVTASSNDGLGGAGSMYALESPSRRRSLMAASGAAGVAGAQSALGSSSGGTIQNAVWNSIPSGQANFTSGPASHFDMAFTDGVGSAVIVAYRDGDQGDKLSAKFYDGTKFLDLGQPGFTPGAASLTALSISPSFNKDSPWLYCAFKSEATKPKSLAVYKINLMQWIEWYQPANYYAGRR